MNSAILSGIDESERMRADWLLSWTVMQVHTTPVLDRHGYPPMWISHTIMHHDSDPFVVRTIQSLYTMRGGQLIRIRVITDWTESLNPNEVI